MFIMPKKLIFMIPTAGRSVEQVSAEAWAAFIKYRATELGLSQCNTCGEYRGSAIDDGERIPVSCICRGLKCAMFYSGGRSLSPYLHRSSVPSSRLLDRRLVH